MSNKEQRSIEQIGEDGEKLFKEWLDKSGLAYLYVKQDPDQYATLFGNQNVKRPDFLVLLDSIGLIAVDVKNYQLSQDNCYTLNTEKEIIPALNFERLLRLPMWYAYCDEESESWYWISALKAISVDVAKKRTKKENGESFLAIKRKEFVEIKENDDIGLLFAQRIGKTSIESFVAAT
ncbi:MAG: hypothetical protein JXQ90_18510 [Cyclobacteriaceae bacterium]